MRDEVKIALDVATPVPVHYPIAVLRDSRRAGEARAFVDLLRTEAARRILVSYGFTAP